MFFKLLTCILSVHWKHYIMACHVPSPPSCLFSDIMLVARKQPKWMSLHHRNWQTQLTQIGAFYPRELDVKHLPAFTEERLSNEGIIRQKPELHVDIWHWDIWGRAMQAKGSDQLLLDRFLRIRTEKSLRKWAREVAGNQGREIA